MTKHSIVVVDDEEDLLDMIVDVLKRDYEVTACPNGIEAKKVIDASPPALVISDLFMPGMDGVSLREHVAAMDEPRPKMIFITAFAEKLKDAGVDPEQILLKPFVMEELLRRVEAALQVKVAQP